MNLSLRLGDRVLVGEKKPAHAPVDAAPFDVALWNREQGIRISVAFKASADTARQEAVRDAQARDVAELILDKLIADEALEIVPVLRVPFLNQLEREPNEASDGVRLARLRAHRIRHPAERAGMVRPHPLVNLLRALYHSSMVQALARA